MSLEVGLIIKFLQHFEGDFIQKQSTRISGQGFLEGETEESVIPVHGLLMPETQPRENQVIVQDLNSLLDFFNGGFVLVEFK